MHQSHEMALFPLYSWGNCTFRKPKGMAPGCAILSGAELPLKPLLFRCQGQSALFQRTWPASPYLAAESLRACSGDPRPSPSVTLCVLGPQSAPARRSRSCLPCGGAAWAAAAAATSAAAPPPAAVPPCSATPSLVSGWEAAPFLTVTVADLGLGAGGVSPGSGFSGRGRLAWEHLVTLCSWRAAPFGWMGRTWVWTEGELGCNAVSVKPAARPTWSSGVGMVFESCPNSGWGGQAFIASPWSVIGCWLPLGGGRDLGKGGSLWRESSKDSWERWLSEGCVLLAVPALGGNTQSWRKVWTANSGGDSAAPDCNWCKDLLGLCTPKEEAWISANLAIPAVDSWCLVVSNSTHQPPWLLQSRKKNLDTKIVNELVLRSNEFFKPTGTCNPSIPPPSHCPYPPPFQD